MHNEALLMHNEALLMHNEALLMHNEALSMHNEALLMHNEALLTLNEALSINNEALSRLIGPLQRRTGLQRRSDMTRFIGGVRGRPTMVVMCCCSKLPWRVIALVALPIIALLLAGRSYVAADQIRHGGETQVRTLTSQDGVVEYVSSPAEIGMVNFGWGTQGYRSVGGWSIALGASVNGTKYVVGTPAAAIANQARYFRISWWVIIAVVTLPGVLVFFIGRRKRLRRKHGLCLHCGYDLRGDPDGSAPCPECGYRPPGPGRSA